jgi:hypothetical protein
VAFGTIFLMISSAAWKTLLGLPQLPQAAAAINLKTINKRVGPFCSIGVGSFYVVKSRMSQNNPEFFATTARYTENANIKRKPCRDYAMQHTNESLLFHWKAFSGK